MDDSRRDRSGVGEEVGLGKEHGVNGEVEEELEGVEVDLGAGRLGEHLEEDGGNDGNRIHTVSNEEIKPELKEVQETTWKYHRGDKKERREGREEGRRLFKKKHLDENLGSALAILGRDSTPNGMLWVEERGGDGEDE